MLYLRNENIPQLSKQVVEGESYRPLPFQQRILPGGIGFLCEQLDLGA